LAGPQFPARKMSRSGVVGSRPAIRRKPAERKTQLDLAGEWAFQERREQPTDSFPTPGTAIKAIADDRAAKTKGVLADSALTEREVAVKLTELTKATDAEIRERRTADQKANWEKMIGKPFHWPKP
jgi:hypothetical protein